MQFTLTPREYEDFVAILEGSPRQCPRLQKLLSEPTPWEEPNEPVQDRNSDQSIQ